MLSCGSIFHGQQTKRKLIDNYKLIKIIDTVEFSSIFAICVKICKTEIVKQRKLTDFFLIQKCYYINSTEYEFKIFILNQTFLSWIFWSIVTVVAKVTSWKLYILIGF